MAKIKKLYAFIGDEQVGVLSQDKGGKIVFRYKENAKRPLSLSLPLEKGTFDAKSCAGYFNGLLPESDEVRKALGKKYSISERNDFALLAAIGYDCPGAVSFSEEEENCTKALAPLDGSILSEENLEKLLQDLPRKPLATGREGMRLSLAGAQDKTSLIMLDGQLAMPSPTTPSTHILKPAIEQFANSVENEYICLRAAQALGIKVPEVRMCYANDTPYFLIERYDRAIEGGMVRRIHQEDFCQAYNIPSSLKYEKEGGLGFAQCFSLINHFRYPIPTMNELIARIIFNFLIGNADAHGKNFSLLHLENEGMQLAPAYDILCTQIYAGINKEMAMRMGKHYLPSEVSRGDMNKFSKSCNLQIKQIQLIAERQIKKLPSALEDILSKEVNDSRMGELIHTQVEQNIELLQKLL